MKNPTLFINLTTTTTNKGVHYAITTHTGHRQIGSQRLVKQLEIGVQLIGERGKTKLIPLQNSQLNKQHPFLAGRKDVFDVLATDVGRVSFSTFATIILCAQSILLRVFYLIRNFIDKLLQK